MTSSNKAFNKPQPKKQPSDKRVSDRDNGNNNPPPSPWLDPENVPQPDPTAGFSEYLRWMRHDNNKDTKDKTKLELLQKAEEKANYSDRLKQLNKRTKLLAGENNIFEVTAPWRIRVGGHRGPESILLPAFDALGIPYIPSSTLRGVARCQAIRYFMEKDGLNWQEAEKKVASYFGDLEAPEDNKSGKVIFFDAYPLSSKSGGLNLDIANNIWSWQNNDIPKYNTNPNLFFSLHQPTFLIGLKLVSNCKDEAILDTIKSWLIQGLQEGIGSQVNSGYGVLSTVGQSLKNSSNEFFTVNFNLSGQLIHGKQKFIKWFIKKNGKWEISSQPHSEVRPIAFKSMLRYWFRVFALGVLEPEKVKKLEHKIFGGINPQCRGWVKINIINGKTQDVENRRKEDPCGKQTGTLVLSFNDEIPTEYKAYIDLLLAMLTWLSFHLGGIGQGARRPCYHRINGAPWYRGSTLKAISKNDFWNIPSDPVKFKETFQTRLKMFYQALSKIANSKINAKSLLNVPNVSSERWNEAADINCKIILVSGQPQHKEKPFALSILHGDFHKLENQNAIASKSLCGGVKDDEYYRENQKIKRKVLPSPIWISDLGDFQLVTIFGANYDPRKKYAETLITESDHNGYQQLFPLDGN